MPTNLIASPVALGATLNAEQFALFDDGATNQLFELVQGRLVTQMAPGVDHGEYEVNISAELRAFVRPRRLGHVSAGEARILTRRAPDTVRMADVLYISHVRLAGETFKGTLAIAPELVVEVVSPDDSHAEVLAKIGEYLEMGVTVVWIVLPKQTRVCAYRSIADVQVFDSGDTLTLPDILPGFELPVANIFE